MIYLRHLSDHLLVLLQLYEKRVSGTREFWENLNNTFFTEHIRVTASLFKTIQDI